MYELGEGLIIQINDGNLSKNITIGLDRWYLHIVAFLGLYSGLVWLDLIRPVE